MMNKTTKRNRDKILKCLAEARAEGEEYLWVREIERRTKINMGTIVWILRRYLVPNYVELPDVDLLISRGLKIQPIKLKDEVFEKMTAITGAALAEVAKGKGELETGVLQGHDAAEDGLYLSSE